MPTVTPGPPPWQRWLYLGATLALLLPLWTVLRVATVDGACHLYNAWVMRHLHDPAYPLFATHFYVDPEPVPNWLIQTLLYGLLAVAPPAVAEKLLLSLYVVLFAAAAWWFAGSQAPQRRANAFLALPFIYNLLFHYGFYNFLFSLPLFLFAVGWWWRGRERPTWTWAVVLNGLLLACYFAHIVSLVMAGFTIAVLWAASFERARWRRWLLQPLVLLPQLILPFRFVSSRPGALAPSAWTLQEKWLNLSELRPLFAFRTEHWQGIALAVLFAALAVATVVGRREPEVPAAAGPPARHAFLLAALAAVLLYFAGPSGVAGGSVLEPRLVLYPFLLLLPGLAPPWPRLSRTAVAVALSLLVGWESWSLAGWLGRASQGVDELLAGHARVRPDSRVIDIIFDIYASLDRQVSGAHAVGYLVAEKRLIDWGDYQAGTGYFPVRFRPGVEIPRHSELLPQGYRAGLYAPLVDYVYTRAMPPDSPLRPRLRQFYRPISQVGAGQLWERREWNPRRFPGAGALGQ